ncbi:DASH complex subunit dad2 [Emydomyces testavorans]|uniref:DASH complex subunit DAD2 n=1 Tax=Emydomyces testavorans TaxID=2070801 RepID=A0AAF0IF36_9EURO|nr:DASH complex subunit dad2 [Emydomyces testavorans]
MAHGPRPTGLFASSAGQSIRHSSGLPNSSAQHSSILAARVAAKQAELEDLKQLRDVSSALATQMEALSQKLETLRDGAEAVACVMANWENVLRAISMASRRLAQTKDRATESSHQQGDVDISQEPVLPAPLVRIPAEPVETASRNEA